MTFKDRNALLQKKFYGAHKKNLNKGRPILSAAKCRPRIVVSRNIRHMQMFVGFFGEGVSNDSELHDQLANLDRYAQLKRCFSAVAELLVKL